MKKTSVLLFAVAVMLSSCGIIAQQSSTDNGHRFQDGIYSSSPSFISKDEKEVSQQKTEELVQKTKSSEIYLLGETKDTIMIPENMSARIQFDQKVGGTVVTVGENPYDWRWDLAGSSWYWSRHYSPYWSSWGFSPWYHGSWYGSSWYYSGWYDPWYYNPWYGSSWYYGAGYYGGWYGYYDPWYYGGWYGWNCGWYSPWYHNHYYHHHGWYNPHHHYPSHGPGHIIAGSGGHKNRYNGPRAHTNGTSLRRNDGTRPGAQSATTARTSTTVRRGIGTSSSTSRNASISRGSSTSRSASASRSGSTTYRRPASSTSSSGTVKENSGSGYYRSSGSTYNRPSGGSGGYERSSGSYSRSSSSSGGGSFSRGSSSGGYSRGSSSGSYRR